MEAFFSGTVIFLYFIAHYAAEPIFVVASSLVTIYGAAVVLFLRFGGCGRMIAARKKGRRFLKKGVISGDLRESFYAKCVKRTPPAFRAAYSLFLEGKVSREELALVGAKSVSVRRDLLKGGAFGLGASASLLVFLTFYFIVPIGETLLRTAICALHAATSGVALHFLLYGYAIAGEKAAARFSEMLDGSLLRERREDMPVLEERKVPTSKDRAEDADVATLRRMLREIEGSAARRG